MIERSRSQLESRFLSVHPRSGLFRSCSDWPPWGGGRPGLAASAIRLIRNRTPPDRRAAGQPMAGNPGKSGGSGGHPGARPGTLADQDRSTAPAPVPLNLSVGLATVRHRPDAIAAEAPGPPPPPRDQPGSPCRPRSRCPAGTVPSSQASPPSGDAGRAGHHRLRAHRDTA